MKILILLPIIGTLACATLSLAEDNEKPRAEMQEKLEKAKHRIEELHASGQHDEAERLAQRLRQEMRSPGDGDRSDRAQHIMEAVKHLRAAGLNEPADSIERMAREQQKAQPRSAEQAVPREAMEQMQRALRETQEQMQRSLKETHEEMLKLARTVAELHEQIGKRKEHD